MDWGLGTVTVTVVAFSDGSASVYFSTGGGYIGGQGQQSVSDAAKGMVALAVQSVAHMHVAESFPLPTPSEVIFYVLTDKGVLTASASVADLSQQKSPLSKLGNAAQKVITLFRTIANKPQ